MTKILIAVMPGYFRNSLAALVRTLPQSQILVINDALPIILDTAKRFSPDILILDGNNALDGVHYLRDSLPGCKFLFMADSLGRDGFGRKRGREVVLPKSVSTGELLAALHGLSAEHRPLEMEPAYGFI